MQKIIAYFTEVKGEISKVVWPTKDQVVRLTLIVLVFSAIVGTYLGTLDYILTKVLEVLIAR